MNTLLIVIIILALIFIVSIVVISTEQTTKPSCYSDNDCRKKQICLLNGKCSTVECKNNSDCNDSNMICHKNSCKPINRLFYINGIIAYQNGGYKFIVKMHDGFVVGQKYIAVIVLQLGTTTYQGVVPVKYKKNHIVLLEDWITAQGITAQMMNEYNYSVDYVKFRSNIYLYDLECAADSDCTTQTAPYKLYKCDLTKNNTNIDNKTTYPHLCGPTS